MRSALDKVFLNLVSVNRLQLQASRASMVQRQCLNRTRKRDSLTVVKRIEKIFLCGVYRCQNCVISLGMRVWTQLYETNQLCWLSVITEILKKNDEVTFTTPLHIRTQVPVTWHKLFLSLEIIFLMGSSRPDRKYPRSHLHQISSQNVRGSVARNSSDVFAGQWVSSVHKCCEILMLFSLRKSEKKTRKVHQDSRWPGRDLNHRRSEFEKRYLLS